MSNIVKSRTDAEWCYFAMNGLVLVCFNISDPTKSLWHHMNSQIQQIDLSSNNLVSVVCSNELVFLNKMRLDQVWKTVTIPSQDDFIDEEQVT